MAFGTGTLDWAWTSRNQARDASDMLASLASLGGRYYNVPPYNDEPKLFHVASMFPGDLDEQGLGRASGSSLSKDRAIAKALGETVERLGALPPARLTGPVAEYTELSEPALNPASIPFACRGRVPSGNDMVAWVGGHRIEGRGVSRSLVPAQLVYLPYQCVEGEPLWFIPTSNGLGAGTSVEQALMSGLLEILERDALMRFWADPEMGRVLHRPASGSHALSGLLEVSDRYGFSIQFVSLPTLAGAAHTVLAALVDDEGDWPRYSFGLKAGFDLEAVMLGALEEAHQLRPWLREVKEAAQEPPTPLRTIDDRAIWWVGSHGRTETSVRLGAARAASDQSSDAGARTLGELTDCLEGAGHDLFFVHLVSPVVGFSVVRALVPTVAPVYFDERFAVTSTRPNAFALTERHPLL